MIKELPFCPDWDLPAPAVTLCDSMVRKGLSLEQLCERIGLSVDELTALLKDERYIDEFLASRIAQNLGGSASFWMSRQSLYLDSLSSRSQQSLKSFLSDAVPLRDMVSFGWLAPFRREDSDLDAACRFFGLTHKDEFLDRYEVMFSGIAFRRSQSFDVELGSLAAWIRAAELSVRDQEFGAFKKEGLLSVLPEVRELSREADPQKFIPSLKKFGALAGLAIVVLRAPRGCPVSGAAWFSEEGLPIIALSSRHLTDDHFWFSFFHELGHIVLHANEDRAYIDMDSSVSGSAEEEANNFAANWLVPSEHVEAMRELSVNKFEVARFARNVGVSPGVVVGQMQHAGIIRRNQLNGLKRRFKWDRAILERA